MEGSKGEDHHQNEGITSRKYMAQMILFENEGNEKKLKERPYFEEHIFTDEWFRGYGELAGFKLWLPIRKV